ncbi:MAG: protein kinase [Myxococcales bacterium]|nr:protein kinase [Myxococcales bacterium]
MSMGRSDAVAKGRYVIHREIARGGMATVHLGQLLGPAGFSKLVAIKQMRAAVNDASEFVAMFLDEAWLAARIQHPNVVATLDVVADHQGLFIVMEYIAGTALSGALKATRAAGQQVDFGVALAIASQMLAGLHAAHETKDEDGRSLQVVHRDISPQNVLVGVDGLARIVDFGVAKAATRLHVTHGDALKGKLAYMAPEQVACDSTLDRRGDVFAASVVIWEMLAGRRLFAGSDFDEIVAAVLTKEIPRLSDLRSDVPRAFDDVLAKGLARDRDERFATADELALALERLGRPATTRALSEWVRSLCESDISQREALVRELERGGPRSAGSLQVVIEGTRPGVADGPHTGLSDAVTQPFAPPSRRRAVPPALRELASDEGSIGAVTDAPKASQPVRSNTRKLAWAAFVGATAAAVAATVALALSRSPTASARPASEPSATEPGATSPPTSATAPREPEALAPRPSSSNAALSIEPTAKPSSKPPVRPGKRPSKPGTPPGDSSPAWGF